MKQDDQIPGQMNIFDFLDMPSSKTSKEPYQATTEPISEWYLKKCAGSKTKMPMFLNLGGESGHSADASLAMGIPWLGDSTMQSISGFHNEDEDYVYSLISMDTQQPNWFLNCGEKPIIPKPSKLSEILDLNCDLEKYKLSPKACQGILNRARKRNKKLPEILEYALIKQSSEGGAVSFQERSGKPGGGKGILIQNEHTGTLSTLNNQSVVYGISPYASNAMLSKNPNSGKYEADTARTLDLNGGNPACNQGGMAIVQKLYTIGHDERSARYTDDEITDPLTSSDFKDPIKVCYGLDRASFNQGQNAQFDFSIEEEKAQTLVAKGPGGGISNTVGALCARDYKGVGNQYVDEGKVIVQVLDIGESSE